jgi:hypothetical protein
MGAFLALRAKNRAFRSKSSKLPMQFLRAFRCNPLRGLRASSNFASQNCDQPLARAFAVLRTLKF